MTRSVSNPGWAGFFQDGVVQPSFLFAQPTLRGIEIAIQRIQTHGPIYKGSNDELPWPSRFGKDAGKKDNKAASEQNNCSPLERNIRSGSRYSLLIPTLDNWWPKHQITEAVRMFNYAKTTHSCVICDANIWLHLHSPDNDDDQQRMKKHYTYGCVNGIHFFPNAFVNLETHTASALSRSLGRGFYLASPIDVIFWLLAYPENWTEVGDFSFSFPGWYCRYPKTLRLTREGEQFTFVDYYPKASDFSADHPIFIGASHASQFCP